MASVEVDVKLHERVDRYLEYLCNEWQDIPEVGQEWDSWTADEQLDFVIELPIREDRLQQLQQWAAAGQLTPAQRARYEELLSLIVRHRATLDRLLAE